MSHMCARFLSSQAEIAEFSSTSTKVTSANSTSIALSPFTLLPSHTIATILTSGDRLQTLICFKLSSGSVIAAHRTDTSSPPSQSCYPNPSLHCTPTSLEHCYLRHCSPSKNSTAAYEILNADKEQLERRELFFQFAIIRSPNLPELELAGFRVRNCRHNYSRNIYESERSSSYTLWNSTSA